MIRGFTEQSSREGEPYIRESQSQHGSNERAPAASGAACDEGPGQVMAASSSQIAVLAHDGALRFARMAREAINASDVKAQSLNILRAQEIVLHLLSSMDSDASPNLAYDLVRIYVHVHSRLGDANLNSDPQALDEAIKLLQDLRDAWAAVDSEQGPPLKKAA